MLEDAGLGGPPSKELQDLFKAARKEEPGARKKLFDLNAAKVKKAEDYCSTLESEVAALERKIGPAATSLLPKVIGSKEKAPLVRARALAVRKCHIEDALGDAPKTPAPAATKTKPALTAAAIGKAVIKTTTHPDAAIRQSAQAALATITNGAAIAARLGLTPEASTCTREEFDSLSPRQKVEFSRNGGRTSAEQKAAGTRPANIATVATLTRSQWSTLNPAEKMAFIKRGGRLTD